MALYFILMILELIILIWCVLLLIYGLLCTQKILPARSFQQLNF